MKRYIPFVDVVDNAELGWLWRCPHCRHEMLEDEMAQCDILVCDKCGFEFRVN